MNKHPLFNSILDFFGCTNKYYSMYIDPESVISAEFTTQTLNETIDNVLQTYNFKKLPSSDAFHKFIPEDGLGYIAVTINSQDIDSEGLYDFRFWGIPLETAEKIEKDILANPNLKIEYEYGK